MFKAGFALALAAAVAGCQGPGKRLAAFNPEEYEPYARAGTGAIVGQAFLVRDDGIPVPAAGRTVFCNPVTTYSTEFYNRWVVGYEVLEESDPRADEAPFWKTTGDVDGRFRFEGLPAGEYYVYSWINWQAIDSNSYVGAYRYNTGGVAHARVTVREGETNSVIVTR